MVTFLMADPGFRQAVEGILRSNRLLTLVYYCLSYGCCLVPVEASGPAWDSNLGLPWYNQIPNLGQIAPMVTKSKPLFT